ncbi:FkbM family methyltransferase [Asaia krungthepensis]|uniref:FkbM family methyltransferase n=1 Tax=Asaia krungthepensis TaxID=220990 RepID=UPI00222EAED8|nr:FkbM family methyltransferase [Asaia krungthepensis]
MNAITNPYALVEARYGTMLANRFDTYIGQALIQYGEYGEHELDLPRQYITHPGTVVEVGANIGSQTVALAQAARAVGGDLVAFEPQPFLFQNLCANLALNGIDNAIAWPFAVSAQAGSVAFGAPDYRQPGNFGSVSMREQGNVGDVIVPSVRLDDVLAGRQVRLIKIDVEGFEMQVLRGAAALITSCRPVIYIENDRPAQSQALIEYLWRRGYRLWWHVTTLFNDRNHRQRADNVYQGFYSYNMICLPFESQVTPEDLPEVTDSGAHPGLKTHEPETLPEMQAAIDMPTPSLDGVTLEHSNLVGSVCAEERSLEPV